MAHAPAWKKPTLVAVVRFAAKAERLVKAMLRVKIAHAQRHQR